MKVPKREISLLLEQRGARKMVISDIDKNVSKMWAQAAARDEAMEVAVEIQKGQAGFRQEQVQLDFLTAVLTMQATTTRASMSDNSSK